MKISFSTEDPMRPEDGPPAASVGELMSNLRRKFIPQAASDQYELHDCGFKGLPSWNPDGIETARVCQSCGEIQERPYVTKQGAD